MEDLKATILAAVSRARARGITIGHDWGIEARDSPVDPQRWWPKGSQDGSERECVCPMGAVLLGSVAPSRPGTSPDFEGLSAEALGVDSDWVCAFLDGYDDIGSASPDVAVTYMTEEARLFMALGDPLLAAGYELGREMREMFGS